MMNNINRIPRSQRGVSTFDFMLWLGLAMVALLVWFGLVGPMMTTQKANGMMGELSTFQLKIHEAYNGQSTGYTGISDTEIINSKAYPTNLNATATTLTSTNTGAITISSDDGGGLTFTIEYAAVPSGVCRAIVNKLASAGGWNEVDISGTAIWAGTAATPTKTATDTACGASATVPMKFLSN